MKRPAIILIPLLLLSLLLCLTVAFSDRLGGYRLYYAAGEFVLAALVAVCLWHALAVHEKKQRALMDDVFAENASASARVIREVSIPCLLAAPDGAIVWRNEVMEKLVDAANIRQVMPQYDPAAPLAAFQFAYANGSYQVMSMVITRKSVDRTLVLQYWIDRTEAAHYRRLFEERQPHIALIYVDNYEELTSDLQFHRTSVLAEVERLVAQTTKSIEGVYRRYDSGRFLLIFEAAQLQQLEESRFSLLEEAHRIDTGTGMSVTLSIAIGAESRVIAADESARQAMELALGRGGDQAVVKEGTKYRFYGGKRQLESAQSRVKARLFSKAFRQLLENAGDVIVMGHRHADMDSLGAALGILVCAKQLGSRAFVVLEAVNSTIDRAVDSIHQNAALAEALISPEQAKNMLRPNSVLVVVDTQRAGTTAAPELLGMATRVVLIDHHRRSADAIENATLHYLESRASSASELITEVLTYFDDALRPPAFICSALLAGIAVDTKHFSFNVGARTFEAAAYLRKNGADLGLVKELFQNDMESYLQTAECVKSAIFVADGIALATVGASAAEPKFIAAKAADELVSIRDIEAAFVLTQDGHEISISGRSLGRVNVQIILERLGGGGHLTMAGAQLRNISMEEAIERLRATVEQYIEEGNQA